MLIIIYNWKYFNICMYIGIYIDIGNNKKEKSFIKILR